MKLIRLEWEKINPAPYLGTALGLLALSMLIALLFCFLPESEWGPAQMSLSRNWHFLILLVSCVHPFFLYHAGRRLKFQSDPYRIPGKKQTFGFFLANQPQNAFLPPKQPFSSFSRLPAPLFPIYWQF